MRRRISAAPVLAGERRLTARWLEALLPFSLTGDQRRAVSAIDRSLAQPSPMQTLLMGEVGSGKTVLALYAMLRAVEHGCQGALMAPTETLAEQHFATIQRLMPGEVIAIGLLSGSTPARRRADLLGKLATGECSLVVGTHALIESTVRFARLGVAVVDEQHRFGTRQRELLRGKSASARPHFLAMTATPIPRSLALALYGEMALSTLDELPPGRTPVATAVVNPDQREQAYELVRREVQAGRQAFVICPLIEESESSEARAATAEFERLRTKIFPDLRLALVHGRLKDKDEVMRRFKARESDVLVATAVVEVGVDVPNATVMLIEGAERFGLAQLHQFRGRVGRGSAQSTCLLLAEEPSSKSMERLNLLAHEHNGFRLATEDMRLRGAGELMGARQHGMSDLAMEGLGRPELLSEVRQEAERVLESADAELLREAARRRLEQTAIS
ncbi:MAG: hypothetical protein DLM67_03435 [Candidatus Nephthysia bennettiae]|nr:MAG: hypothetical protein DLM67_03435 [Candidatus Dormibacteraeota bacterium]